jgi:hypothetical protein
MGAIRAGTIMRAGPDCWMLSPIGRDPQGRALRVVRSQAEPGGEEKCTRSGQAGRGGSDGNAGYGDNAYID